MKILLYSNPWVNMLKNQCNFGALGFLGGDRITRFLHVHDEITPNY
jgi:hypothetical protein